MNNFFISVVIPTYNREKVLCETISDLLHQDDHEVEIVVIDQSKEHMIETDRFLAKVSNKIRYFHKEEIGLPGARNAGLQQAKGDIVIFIDDDVRLCDGFIKNHVVNYLDDSVGGVAGKVIENVRSYSLKNPRFLKKLYGISKFGLPYPNRGGSERSEVLGFPGGNFSVRKNILQQVGLFDANFKGNALFEESDMAYRIRKRGYKIIFDPQASLYHLRAPDGGCRMMHDLEYQYWRFRNGALFFLKNMPKVYFLLFIVTSFFVLLKHRSSFHSSFWSSLVKVYGGVCRSIQLYLRNYLGKG